MVFVWLVSAASAHITMEAPTTRGPDQKIGPCGSATDNRGTATTTFQPGQTITVRWKETINHPSHYRISFDAEGTDDFADPATPTDFYTNAAVLLDEIPDDGTLSARVALPDLTCDRCTLQLVQVMLDKPPYEPGTNDLYYQCADLVLAGEPAGPGGEETAADTSADTGTGPADDAGCGCSTGSTGAPWFAALGLAAAVTRRSTRRNRRAGSVGRGGGHAAEHASGRG